MKQSVVLVCLYDVVENIAERGFSNSLGCSGEYSGVWF